jgi:arginyl-tRNA synthetase
MLRDALRDAVAGARRSAIEAGDLRLPDGTSPDALPPVSIERPAHAEHGDYATNAAMRLAPVLRAAPFAIAETIRAHLQLPDGVAETSVERPGFLNFRLDPGWVGAQVAVIREAGAAWGRVRVPDPQKINVEFVSANPTGPLTVGNARGAFVGDLLCRVLEGAGHDVTREYYFNDAGTQITNLGRSVLARRAGEEVPEDGYHGAYVRDLAAQMPAELLEAADPVAAVSRWASERVRAGIEDSLERLGVRFDVWKSEASVHAEGWVERGVERLRSAGVTDFVASEFSSDPGVITETRELLKSLL